MTRRMRIELRLRSPLCIARRPTAPGQPIATLPYISGTVLRGALATAWLEGRRYEELAEPEQQRFQALFARPAVRFGNCLPRHPEHPGARTDVVPMTAWADKHRPRHWLADDGPGVYDQLVIFLRGEPSPDHLDRLDARFAANDDGHYTALEPRRRLIARTAIDPERDTARDGQLYTLEALETGQIFSGVISADEQLIEELERGVLQIDQTLTMGQGRSRGMGEVTIEDLEAAEEPEQAWAVQLAAALPASIEQTSARDLLIAAVEHFNRRIGTAGSADGDLFLPVTLESDVLLRDNYLLPSSDARPAATLARYRPGPPPTMRVHLPGVAQSVHWIGGWDELRRLPRPPQLAVAIGSVWTFQVARAELGAAVDWWLAAQRDGLGERRGEGFGQVRLCHPLHLMEGPL